MFDDELKAWAVNSEARAPTRKIDCMIAMTPLVGDAKYVNATTGMGMSMCLTTGILFWWHGFRRGESSSFYKNVFVYSIAWGVAQASQRYFALADLPVGQFLFSWYLGSFLTMITVFAYRKWSGRARESAVAFSVRDIAWIALFASGIVLCLGIEYWAKILAPQTAVGPILLVAEATVPTTVGLLVFKEGASLDRHQWGFAILGIIGVVTLAYGLHMMT